MAKPSRKVTPPDDDEALAAQIVETMMSLRPITAIWLRWMPE